MRRNTGWQRPPQNAAPSKSLCTDLLFSQFLTFVLSCHHTPSHAHNQHTRQDKGPLMYSLSGSQRSSLRDIYRIQKPPPSPGAALPLATLALFLSQTKKQTNTLLSPGHQIEQPCSLGHPPYPELFPLPLLPFLLYIAHVSHQMSYQSLQQMHPLTLARERATRIQSCNPCIMCNELMGKYFCLIRIFSNLLIILSRIWLASSFVPAIIAGQLLVHCMYVSLTLSPAGRGVLTLPLLCHTLTIAKVKYCWY